MSHWRTVWSLGLLITATNAAYGDIAAGRSPRPKPPMVAPVKVVEGKVDDADPNVVARIVIPRSLLPDLQESPSEFRRPQGSTESAFDGMTIIAGLALTAGAISLMFANKKSPHWKKWAIALIGCVLLFGIMLLADVFSPPKLVAPTADQSQPQRLIVFEVQEHGHEVTLILPNSQ